MKIKNIEIGNKVTMNKDVEVTPLNFVYKGTQGEVLDETCPFYFLVKFPTGVYWVDGLHLEVE